MNSGLNTDSSRASLNYRVSRRAVLYKFGVGSMVSAPITTEIWRPQKPHEEKSANRPSGRNLVKLFKSAGRALYVNLRWPRRSP